MAVRTKREMAAVREALAACSSETRRIVTEEVLALPAIQHMLSSFLADSSRSFEDWIREPRCWHSLNKLSDRIDSADGPAVTANYQEQVAFASYERVRTSTAGGWGSGGVGRAADAGGWGRGVRGGEEGATSASGPEIAAKAGDGSRVSEVWYVRHGKPGKKTLEMFDSALTDVGHVQASTAGLYLSTLPFNQQRQQRQPGSFGVIYTSPLARAVQTAVCVSQALGNLPLQVVPGLCACTAAIARRGGFRNAESELMTDEDIAEAFPEVTVRPRDPLAPTSFDAAAAWLADKASEQRGEEEGDAGGSGDSGDRCYSRVLSVGHQEGMRAMVAAESGVQEAAVVPRPHGCVGVFRVARTAEKGAEGTCTYELHDILASTGESLKPGGRGPSSYARPSAAVMTTSMRGVENGPSSGPRNGDDGAATAAAAAEALAERVMGQTVHAEGSRLRINGTESKVVSRKDPSAGAGAGVVGGGGDVAPSAASPWPPSAKSIAHPHENSGKLLAVGNGGEGGDDRKGGLAEEAEEEDDDEEEEVEEERTFDMMMVMSEAMKEDAKVKFQRGEYMGAAKAYIRAATALEERAAPTAARFEPLRRRLRSLYETCMCNAAVAGFKAAAASPAPGEAHSLVVDACSKALARCEGRCPKARFWRARVNICQRMYEAAEADLKKAVEEEEEEEEERRQLQKTKVDKQSAGAPEESCGGSSGGAIANGAAPASGDPAALRPKATPSMPNGTSATSNGTFMSPNGTCTTPNGTSTIPTGTPTTSNGPSTNPTGASTPSNGPPPASGSIGTAAAAAATDHFNSPRTSTASGRVGGEGSSGGGDGGGSGVGEGSSGGGGGVARGKKRSEAARWLSVVRAKVADMNAARALAAEQASAREENAVAGRERALELLKRRSRYGPGHVPRHASKTTTTTTPEGEAGDGEGEGERDNACAVTGKISTSAGVGVGVEALEDVVPGWRVPRPPPLKVANQSPAMVLNNYSVKARFQAPAEFEQVTGEDGQPEYLCTIRVGPEDRVVGHGRGSNMKAAKQEASRELLTNAALAWNEENPEDLIDMEMMVPLEDTLLPQKPSAPSSEITQEFEAYCAAWVDKVVREEVHEACFPNNIDKFQRKYVHGMVEELNNPEVLSKSATIKGRRRLSVMRKAMMEGMAFMSGDNVVVIDLPPPPTTPADVGDLASITRPPPERKMAAASSGGAPPATDATFAAVTGATSAIPDRVESGKSAGAATATAAAVEC